MREGTLVWWIKAAGRGGEVGVGLEEGIWGMERLLREGVLRLGARSLSWKVPLLRMLLFGPCILESICCMLSTSQWSCLAGGDIQAAFNVRFLSLVPGSQGRHTLGSVCHPLYKCAPPKPLLRKAASDLFHSQLPQTFRP